jgi:hypothetical protein
MRRIVHILLLVILPIQFAWAAASGYCRHEKGNAAEHFGHHQHQHKTASGDASKASTTAKLSGVDADCATCHLSAAQSIVSMAIPFAAVAAEAPRSAYRLAYRSHIPIGPERPDRGLAV